MEDLRVYPTRRSQEVIDRAINVKCRRAELMWVNIDVDAVPFNKGFYTVDIKYFYQITADAFCGVGKPTEISGLATFDKRVILFGSEGNAKIFSSKTSLNTADDQLMRSTNLPTAVVETEGYLWEGFHSTAAIPFRAQNPIKYRFVFPAGSGEYNAFKLHPQTQVFLSYGHGPLCCFQRSRRSPARRPRGH